MSKITQTHKQNLLTQIQTHTTDTCPFKTAYGPKHKVQKTFIGAGRTKQSFKDESDINVIMRRYQQSGILPDYFNPQQPQYLDVTGVEFDAAMQLVAEAQSMFHELPSNVRARFNNDPGAFLDFTSDPANRLEMAEMGLLKAQTPSTLSPQAKSTEPLKTPSNPLPDDSASAAKTS